MLLMQQRADRPGPFHFAFAVREVLRMLGVV